MKSEYDKRRDLCLWEKAEVFTDQFNRLDLAIYQYGDKGKPKLQISRLKWDKPQDKWTFVKLGRMSQSEFAAVARAAKEGFEAIQGEPSRVPAGFAPIDDETPF